MDEKKLEDIFEDDGEPGNVRNKIGMKYVRQMLLLMYGDQGKLSVYSKPTEGTTIEIQIPLQGKGGNSDENSAGGGR